MKKILLIAILVVASTLTNWSAYAQQTPSVEESVKQIVEELDDVQGVDCLVVTKGLELAIVKGVFTSKFGKEFMKDATSLILVNFSKASVEVRESFKSRIEAFSGQLQEFSLNKQDFQEEKYIKSYATINEGSLISDFMVIMENDKSAMFFYMGGILDVSKMQLNL